MIKLSSIKPNPNNPRTIKDEKFDKLVKSIREFPKMMALRPMVVDKDGILLGGNMRYKALVAIGYTEIDESWIRRAEDLTPEEINRFVIVDNVSFGEFDWAILEDWNQEELEEWGLDIEFSEPEKEVEEDNYEAEVPEIPRTKKGDLYHIGEHKLLCGDSTKKEEWAKIMGSELCDMVMTDPPYNVDYEGGTGMKIMNDKMGDKLFYQFLKDFYTSLAFYTKKGGAWYVWHADSEGLNFRSAMANTGIMLKQCLIWVKNSLVMGRQDYQWKHEPCLYGWVEGGPHYFTDERTHTTVIEDIIDLDKMKKAEMKELLEIIMSDQTKTSVIHCNRPTRSDLHPTMKPILLLAPLIKNSSRRNEIVGDGFLGSGSTMVASHQLNRRCYGMELDPKYCDVIIDRMLKLDPDLIITKNGEDVTSEWIGEPEDE